MGILPQATFVAVALLTGCAYIAVLQWLHSISEVQSYTAAQLGVAVFYGFVLAAWAGAEAGFFVFSKQPQYKALQLNDAADEEDGTTSTESLESEKAGPMISEASLFGLKLSSLKTLRAVGEFTLIMGYIYLCDRTTLIAKGPKQQSRMNFWGLNLAIIIVALFTLTPAPQRDPDAPPKPLQRDQTEEWKGWMQLMFILYHYFAEAEIYNAIRLYIAAYVWMTGFGNFSYYYIKQDFTLLRFSQMMWRLNFFVFFVCVTMNNEYMLYYICPMHTFFTLMVFIPLWMFNKYNTSDLVCTLKIGATLVVAIVLYDVPGVFHTVFYPFTWLLAFHDPLHPEFTDSLHEWFFRSGLDHIVWVFGMLCALCFPWFDRKLQELERLPTNQRLPAKAGVVGCTLLVMLGWGIRFFSLGKRDYNKVHPFTSWIAILGYLILRNMSPLLRTYSMHLFSWCGKVTLETYILQFHIWMKTTGLNGSPKHLMVFIPQFFWLNFLLTSFVYLLISYRVFHLTVALRDICIPKETGTIIKRGVSSAMACAAFYGVGCFLQQ